MYKDKSNKTFNTPGKASLHRVFKIFFLPCGQIETEPQEEKKKSAVVTIF